MLTELLLTSYNLDTPRIPSRRFTVSRIGFHVYDYDKTIIGGKNDRRESDKI